MLHKLRVWWEMWWHFGVWPWQFERDVRAVRQLTKTLHEVSDRH